MLRCTLQTLPFESLANLVCQWQRMFVAIQLVIEFSTEEVQGFMQTYKVISMSEKLYSGSLLCRLRVQHCVSLLRMVEAAFRSAIMKLI